MGNLDWFPELADSRSPFRVTQFQRSASATELPSMNRNILYQTLIRAARTEKVEQAVPPGFEARVLSAIHRVEPNESLRRWASVLENGLLNDWFCGGSVSGGDDSFL